MTLAELEDVSAEDVKTERKVIKIFELLYIDELKL